MPRPFNPANMPGKLAGLFGYHQPPETALSQPLQQALVEKPVDYAQVRQQLAAIRDPETVVKGQSQPHVTKTPYLLQQRCTLQHGTSTACVLQACKT